MKTDAGDERLKLPRARCHYELKGSSVERARQDPLASGEAEVKPEDWPAARVIDILKNVKDKAIRIEGHTDNVKIGRALARKYRTNWELSAARAINVTRYLQSRGSTLPFGLRGLR